jgi:hypothetical protein
MRVRWTTDAADDLEQISDYISEVAKVRATSPQNPSGELRLASPV